MLRKLDGLSTEICLKSNLSSSLCFILCKPAEQNSVQDEGVGHWRQALASITVYGLSAPVQEQDFYQ